jgi:hypothetical protein
MIGNSGVELADAMVGTPRCGVTARKAGGILRGKTSDNPRCAAERGADGAARRPYHNPALTSENVPPAVHPPF